MFNESASSAVGVLGRGDVIVGAGAVLEFTNFDVNDDEYSVQNTISGAGSLLFDGGDGGVTQFGQVNSITGGATINSGIVNIFQSGGLGSGPITMTGGALRQDLPVAEFAIGSAFTLSGVIGLGRQTNIAGAVTLADNTSVTASLIAGDTHWTGDVSLGGFTLSTSDVGPNTRGATWAGEALSISGAISGTGGVTQNSAGTLILSGANTYSGPTTVTQGTLEVLNTSTNSPVGVLGSGAVSVSANATLRFVNDDGINDDYAIAPQISGAGRIEFAGPNNSVTTLNHDKFGFTGGLDVESGIVNVFGNGIFGSAAVTMTGGALRATTAPTFLSNKFTLSGQVGFGAATNLLGSISLAGDANVYASENFGDSTWSGALALNSHTLTMQNGGPDAAGGSWDDEVLTISGIISGSGAINKASVGALNLNGTNTYTGSTFISQGTLKFGNRNALGASQILFGGAGGTLEADYVGGLISSIYEFAGSHSAVTASGGGAFNMQAPITQEAGSQLDLGANVTLYASGLGATAGSSFLAGAVSGAGTLGVGAGLTTFSNGASLTVARWALSGAGAATVLGAMSYGGNFTASASTTLTLGAASALSFTNKATLNGAVTGAGTLNITSGTATIGSTATLSQGAWGVSGAGTVVTLTRTLAYGGTYTQGAQSTLSIQSGRTLTLTGAAQIAGLVSGLGMLAMSGGSALISVAPTTAVWTSQNETITLGAALNYAGAFTLGSGDLLKLAGGGLVLRGATTLAGVVTGPQTLQLRGAAKVNGATTFGNGGVVNAATLSLVGSGG